MKLLKPSWVHHDDKPIFSVDVHQECLKFATGGQGMDSGRVVIWNLLPVLSEKAEMDAKVPKVLCQMDQHLACVNCVRWSQNGQMLASGSDDKLVMIWRKSQGTSGVFGTGGIQKNPESWKCVYTLRGHSGDVLDLAWAPHDRYLASCSVDNTIIIWDARSFPQMLNTLRGHTGLVKGVSWDPVGKFLASQSDDRSIKIWKTSDWSCSSTIKEPFEECGGTTHILRLSWSPDGQYLVSAHAMNGGGPTAQIIEREGWKCDKDFVGHRKAVTCVRFHNSILRRQSTPHGKGGGKPQQYCCLAVGSRDRSLSVWMTALQRPSVVIHDLFNDSVLDLSWGPKKCLLMACSGDGTIACLQFTDEELGSPLSEDDKNIIFQRIYGKSVLSENGVGSSAFNSVIEIPELLNYPQEKIKPPTLPNMIFNDYDMPAQLPQPVIRNGGRVESALNTPTKAISKQMETRTKDGKRRITPMFIPLNQENAETSVPSMSSSSRSSTTCNNNTAAVGAVGAVLAASTVTSDTAVVTIENASKFDEGQLDPRLIMLPGIKSGSKVQPMQVDPESLKNFPLSITNKPPRKPYGPIINNGNTYQASTIGPKINITATTKCEFYKCALDYRVSVQNGYVQTNHGLLARVRAMVIGDNQRLWEMFVGSPVVNLNFCPKYIMLCSLDGSMRLLEMQTGCLVLPVISLTTAAVQCAFCPTGNMVGVITECGQLRIWNIERCRIVLATNCNEVLSKFGTAQHFNLTDKGVPLINFANGNCYTYSQELQSWLVVNTKDPIMQHGLRTTLPRELQKNYRLYPLLTAQASTHTHGTLNNAIDANAEDWQTVGRISFIENQIKLSEAINSPDELKFWYNTLIYHLAIGGTEKRIRLLLDGLLGTPKAASSSSDINENDNDNESDTDNVNDTREILGISKDDLLEDVLETLKPHLRWQRIYTEYMELYKFCKSARNDSIFNSEPQKQQKKQLHKTQEQQPPQLQQQQQVLLPMKHQHKQQSPAKSPHQEPFHQFVQPKPQTTSKHHHHHHEHSSSSGGSSSKHRKSSSSGSSSNVSGNGNTSSVHSNIVEAMEIT